MDRTPPLRIVTVARPLNAASSKSVPERHQQPVVKGDSCIQRPAPKAGSDGFVRPDGSQENRPNSQRCPHCFCEPGGVQVRRNSERLMEKREKLLKSKAEAGDTQASFLLGHLYYEEGHYREAEAVFDGIKDREPQALYQLAVMYYDGLVTTADPSKAVDYMRRVAECDTGSVRYAALYNLGRAYLQGYGVQASSEKAEKYWLIAADDGNPNASVEAQSSLGLFYSSPEIQDLKRAFYWHSEACANGSLSPRGRWGSCTYMDTVSKNRLAAFYCLTEAAERVCKYEDVSAIAKFTGCNPQYICKGIAIGLFYYARCLQLGRELAQNTEKALHYYTKAALMSPEVFKDLQLDVIYGRM